MQKLVLASSSNYRRELLKKLRLDFISDSRAIDESPMPNEQPAALALRLSLAKARAMTGDYPSHLIIGSDQVAAFGERMLGKPGSRDQAFEQLKAQSGQKMTFYTGICVVDSATNRHFSDIDVCKVYFKNLSVQEIHRYLDADQPWDCAGSFKSEAYGITLLDKIEGEDPNALIGLPLIKLIRLLDQFGWRIP